MLFGKRKDDMVDIRELQKRGVVRIPKRRIDVPTDSDGFVELGSTRAEAPVESVAPETKSNASFFGFMDKPKPEVEPETFSTEAEGYNKREVDAKTSDLDNKIYKLEQRIELLEKKLDVNQPSNAGVMGW